jgi:hypothetical protein
MLGLVDIVGIWSMSVVCSRIAPGRPPSSAWMYTCRTLGPKRCPTASSREVRK